MKLVIISHKPTWKSLEGNPEFVTDGGFPFQMKAISELFDSTKILIPVTSIDSIENKIELNGYNMLICPLTPLNINYKFLRRIAFPFWLFWNSITIIREILNADAVHAPIPGDIGTIGMLAAFFFKKPLFVRYCGNWENKRTFAEIFWKWFLIRFAGNRNVFLATGGCKKPPSSKNVNIKWVFSTSMSEKELTRNAVPNKEIHNNKIVIATLGRQEKGKGTELLIESLTKLIKIYPEIILNIIGDGSQLHKYKQLTHHLGVSKNVIFHGYLAHDEAIQVLKKSDLFCFPTLSEGFPKAVLEALSCNLPVITTNVSVLPELISDKCGRIIDVPSPENISKNIIELISNPNEYKRLSINAGNKALDYSIETWQQTLKMHLEESWGKLQVND